MIQEIKDRRPIRARETGWANLAARQLQKWGATPNGISLFSILFSAIAAICFFFAFYSPSVTLNILLLIVAAICIQVRLICNLLDGMVAIEGGMRSSVGAIYNDLPDRISDTLILLGVGYGLLSFPSAAYIGWAAALTAMMTAYVRVLGGSCGLEQTFSGPMAKQHRMAVLTIASLIAVFIQTHGQLILFIGLWIILLGSVLTAIRRTHAIMRALKQQEAIHV